MSGVEIIIIFVFQEYVRIQHASCDGIKEKDMVNPRRDASDILRDFHKSYDTISVSDVLSEE